MTGFKEIRSGRLRELHPEHRDQQIAYAYEQARLPEGRFLGGETFSAFSERVRAAWNDLLARPWSQALVVLSASGDCCSSSHQAALDPFIKVDALCRKLTVGTPAQVILTTVIDVQIEQLHQFTAGNMRRHQRFAQQ